MSQPGPVQTITFVFLDRISKFFLTFIRLDVLLVLLKVLSLSDVPSLVGSRGVDVRTLTFFLRWAHLIDP